MYKQLTTDEKLALAGIIKWLLSADHENTMEGVEDFFKENDWGDFEEIYTTMDNRFEELEDLQKFLPSITNREAQKIIKQISNDIIMSDALMTQEEKKIIIYLDQIWN